MAGLYNEFLTLVFNMQTSTDTVKYAHNLRIKYYTTKETHSINWYMAMHALLRMNGHGLSLCVLCASLND